MFGRLYGRARRSFNRKHPRGAHGKFRRKRGGSRSYRRTSRRTTSIRGRRPKLRRVNRFQRRRHPSAKFWCNRGGKRRFFRSKAAARRAGCGR